MQPCPAWQLCGLVPAHQFLGILVIDHESCALLEEVCMRGSTWEFAAGGPVSMAASFGDANCELKCIQTTCWCVRQRWPCSLRAFVSLSCTTGKQVVQIWTARPRNISEIAPILLFSMLLVQFFPDPADSYIGQRQEQPEYSINIPVVLVGCK